MIVELRDGSRVLNSLILSMAEWLQRSLGGDHGIAAVLAVTEAAKLARDVQYYIQHSEVYAVLRDAGMVFQWQGKQVMPVQVRNVLLNMVELDDDDLPRIVEPRKPTGLIVAARVASYGTGAPSMTRVLVQVDGEELILLDLPSALIPFSDELRILLGRTVDEALELYRQRRASARLME